MSETTMHTQAQVDPHLVDNLEAALDAGATPKLARRDVPGELLPPPTVGGLARMAVEEWAMIGVLWLAMAFAPPWVYVLLLLPLAGRFHALGVVLHDLTHMPLRGKTAGTWFVEVLCGYPIASTLNAMRYHHLRHHRDSGMETDPYYKDGTQNVAWWTINIVRGLVLVPFWTIRALVGVVAAFVPAVRNVYAHVFLQDRTRADLRHSREVIDCARAEIGQVVFQAAVFGAWMLWPSEVLWGYVVPVSLAALLAARRVLIEHNYERVADRKVDTIIATTNDNHIDWLGALALAPRNIGYHIVHHVHPQVSLRALPRLRAWYAKRYPGLYPPAAR